MYNSITPENINYSNIKLGRLNASNDAANAQAKYNVAYVHLNELESLLGEKQSLLETAKVKAESDAEKALKAKEEADAIENAVNA